MKFLVSLLFVLGINGVADGLNLSTEHFYVLDDISALEVACDDKNAMACMRLGSIYEKLVDSDIEKDEAKAFKYHNKACELNDVGSCASVGIMYFQGVGVEKDNDRAIKFLKKSCSLGNSSRCTYANFIKNKEG